MVNSFILIPKANGKVRLCLDLARLNKVLMRPVHRCLWLNDTLPRLVGMKYLTVIDSSLGYHNLKLDEISYLTIFSCPFGRYQYKRPPSAAALAGDMFQKKADKLFRDMSNVYSTADEILIADFDEWVRDHDETSEKVLWVCRHVNIKLYKEKIIFRCINIPFFGEIISCHGVLRPEKSANAYTDATTGDKKGAAVIMGILNYPTEFLPMTAEVCEPLQKLRSVKTDWTWNRMYQGSQKGCMHEVLWCG